MAEPIRIDLGEPLAGHHIMADPDQLTFGFLEDMQSERASIILDGLATCIVEGDLPHGVDRVGLRKLRLAAIRALIQGVVGAAAVPKS